jgi:hypothetical protein
VIDVARIADALERIADALEAGAEAAGRPPPEALSKEDAARCIGVDVGTVEQLIRERKLAYVQHGAQRGRVVTVAALREFLEEYRQGTVAEIMGRRKRG